MERNFIQSMIMFDGNWLLIFSDTTSLVLFLLTLAALSIPLLQRIRPKGVR